MRTAISILVALGLTGIAVSASAQGISIPDPGLNAAVRQALQIPVGPLTAQDLLSLTNLEASQRNIASLEGLQAAHNLVSLDLSSNLLDHLSIPATLTKLATVDLSSNRLWNCAFPNGLTNLNRLLLKSCQLTNLTLPADLVTLVELNLEGNLFIHFSLPAGLRGVGVLGLRSNNLTEFNFPANLTEVDNLDLQDNLLSNFTLPARLTNIFFIDLVGNILTNVTLPAGLHHLNTLQLDVNLLEHFAMPSGLTRLFEFSASNNQLSNLVLPPDTTNLATLFLSFNYLTNVTLPAELRTLTTLDLQSDEMASLVLSPKLTQLQSLSLSANALTNLVLPPVLTNLVTLDARFNLLQTLVLTSSLPNLKFLYLSGNRLTNVQLPTGMTNLLEITLDSNQLINFTLPPDLYRLTTLDLENNLLTSLTLPAAVTNLVNFFVAGSPLTNLILPEQLATTTQALLVSVLQNQGVSVFTYPLDIQLLRARSLAGAFQFEITGPPAVYSVLASTNMSDWIEVGIVSNQLGSISFVDPAAHLFSQRCYRVRPADPPVEMVFVPANTFTMGSPTNELHRQANEGPQTTVTLTRGFWIGKYEVTQREYLNVTGTNPSVFQGNLTSPVSSVSWPDATNYCWLLTQRELAAGRIPTGSQYRLPTEAEWECAARAGTTTRFSYGDDLDYTNLANYAWFFLNAGLTVHPVGQKLPNPWGLYDMTGNVWEWTQDWLGNLPGGAVTDPQGPPSNAIGVKVVRGGSYDFDVTDCRSARRFSYGSHPALNDSDIGFRVVLVRGTP